MIRWTFTFLAYLLLLAIAPSIQAASNECGVVTLSPDRLTLLESLNGIYQIRAEFSGTDYLISPDQRVLALERNSNSQSGKEVAFYDLTSQIPVEIGIVDDVSFIRGLAWSHDGSKLLLQDAYGNRLLYLFDLDSNQLRPISSEFAPNSEILQVAWNPDDSSIALVAQGLGFPQIDANATALYVVDTMTLNYRLLSLPGEDVEWYYGNFYWLGENTLAFTSCTSDTNQCGINLVKSDGSERNNKLEGNYWLVRNSEMDTLLILDRNRLDAEGSGEAALMLFDVADNLLTNLAQLPVESVTPLPLFDVSNDNQMLSLINGEGKTVIVDLTTSSDSFVPEAIDYDSGEWSPDGKYLLFQAGTDLYIYNPQINQSTLAYSFSEADRPHSSRWLCT